MDKLYKNVAMIPSANIRIRAKSMKTWPIVLALAALTLTVPAPAQPQVIAGSEAQWPVPDLTLDVSDAALVKQLPGFENGVADVNGVRIHYVAGGAGRPVFLLPGWPQTWWSFHKVMPSLSKKYRVYAIDIRGMGSSGKPVDGYDKKTMAKDLAELANHLGYKQVDVVGHDIGAQLAWAFAANHPSIVRKLVMLDVPHPDEGVANWPLLPKHGTFGDRIDEANPFPWWFAFHQVKGLPEDMLEGRHWIEQRWFFRYLAKDESAISLFDRSVYAQAYASRDAIRAGNAWYQTFTQDIIDEASYPRLTLPILGIAGPGYPWMKATFERRATNPQVIKLEGSGHFVAEEKPNEMVGYVTEFLEKSH